MADWTEEEDLLLTRAMKSCNGDLSSVRALLRTKRRRTAAEVKTRIKYLKLDGTSDFKVSLSTGSSSAKPKTSSTISSLHPNSLKPNSTKSAKASKTNARKRSFSKVDTIDDDSPESSSCGRRAKLASKSRVVGVKAQTRRQNDDEDVENKNSLDDNQTKLDVQMEERKNLAIAKSGHSSESSIDTCTDNLGFTSHQPTNCSDVISSTHHSGLPSQCQGQTSNVPSHLPVVPAPPNSFYSSAITAVPPNYYSNTTTFKQTSVDAETTHGYLYRPAPDTDESSSGVPDPRTVTVSSEFGMKIAGLDPNADTSSIDSIGKLKREPQHQDDQSIQPLESTDSGISMNSTSPLDPTSSVPSSFPSSSKSDSSSSSSSTTSSAPDSIDNNTSNTSFFRPSLSTDVFLTKSRSIHLIHQRSLSATRGAGVQEWKQYELPPISPIWGSFCQSGSCTPGHTESCVGGEKPNGMCFSPSVETAGAIMNTGDDGRRTGFVHLTTEHPSENGNVTKRQGFIVLQPDNKLPSLNDVLLSSFPGGIHATGLENGSRHLLESQRRIMDINRSTQQLMRHQNEYEKKMNVIRNVETDVEGLSVQCVRVETQGETDASIGMANPEISISKAKKNKNFKGLKLKLASPSTSSSKSPQLGPSMSSSIDTRSGSSAIQTTSNLSLSNPSDISIPTEQNEKPTFKVPLSKPKLQIQTKITSSQHLSSFGNSSAIGKSVTAGFPTPLTLPLPSPSVPSFGLVSPVTALFPGLDSLTPQSATSNIPSTGLPVYSCSRSSQSVSHDVESTIRGTFNLPDPGRESATRYKDRIDGRVDEMDEDDDEDE